MKKSGSFLQNKKCKEREWENFKRKIDEGLLVIWNKKEKYNACEQEESMKKSFKKINCSEHTQCMLYIVSLTDIMENNIFYAHCLFLCFYLYFVVCGALTND